MIDIFVCDNYRSQIFSYFLKKEEEPKESLCLFYFIYKNKLHASMKICFIAVNFIVDGLFVCFIKQTI